MLTVGMWMIRDTECPYHGSDGAKVSSFYISGPLNLELIDNKFFRESSHQMVQEHFQSTGTKIGPEISLANLFHIKQLIVHL